MLARKRQPFCRQNKTPANGQTGIKEPTHPFTISEGEQNLAMELKNLVGT